MTRSPDGAADVLRQHALGQFPTPAPLADFMASMFKADWRTVRLLDAGAGRGALSVALIHRLCAEKRKPDGIEITAYEVDSSLTPLLRANLERCRSVCDAAGVRLSVVIHDEATGQLHSYSV